MATDRQSTCGHVQTLKIIMAILLFFVIILTINLLMCAKLTTPTTGTYSSTGLISNIQLRTPITKSEEPKEIPLPQGGYNVSARVSVTEVFKSKYMLKNSCQKNIKQNSNCLEIFPDLYKFLAEIETWEGEVDHSLTWSKLKQPLPNFFLLNFTTTAEIYRRANIGFVHLPKSGGTSVEKYLFDHMKSGGWNKHAVTHCSDFKQAICRANVNLTQNFFYSKRTYGLHSFLVSDQPFLYFTWFRDPVSRVVSTYYYLKKMHPRKNAYINRFINPSRSLTNFLQKTKAVQYPDFDNFIVRLLQFGDDHALDNNFEDCCGTNLKAIPVVNEKHYHTAKYNLENMAFIGNMDDWQTSQEMLDFILGFKNDTAEVHTNANPHKLKLTKYERGEIERRNKWDILLHADAMEIYAQQKRAYLQYINQSVSES